jgi:predicted aspartyl protease
MAAPEPCNARRPRPGTAAVLLAAGLAFAAPPPALADGCAPAPKAALGLMLDRVPYVQVSINGSPASLLFDTGAETTLLSVAAAKRLGLTAHFTYPHTLEGIGGGVSVGEVRPDRLALGGLAMPGFLMPVAAISLPGAGGQPLDGLLGADVLSDFDVDIDMPHHRVTLYQPAACASPSLPWRRGYAEVEAHRSLHRHIFFPVQLDGRRLMAIIDTGAQRSAVDAAAAAQTGLTAAMLRQDPPVTVNGMAASVTGSHFHRFGQLRIGPDIWDSPVAIVTPLHLDDADLILGEDFLQAFRVWLSYAPPRMLFARAQ